MSQQSRLLNRASKNGWYLLFSDVSPTLWINQRHPLWIRIVCWWWQLQRRHHRMWICGSVSWSRGWESIMTVLLSGKDETGVMAEHFRLLFDKHGLELPFRYAKTSLQSLQKKLDKIRLVPLQKGWKAKCMAQFLPFQGMYYSKELGVELRRDLTLETKPTYCWVLYNYFTENAPARSRSNRSLYWY